MIFESWFILTLVLTFIAGIASFINKIIVEEKYDRNIAVLTFFLSVLFFSLWIFLFTESSKVSYTVIWYWVVWWIVDYIFMKCRFIALSGISSSLFFVNYRLFSSSALLIVGILLFGDTVTLNEYIGFFIGLIVFGLLFEKEKMKKENYKTGLVFLGICIVMIVFLQSWLKIIADVVQSMENFWFYFATLLIPYALVWSFLTYFKNRKQIDFRQGNIGKNIAINICNGILWTLCMFYLMNAYLLADLGIVYKIYSYSLFIPIVLSIFIYAEKITPKKIIAFLLTIVSLWFFV